MRILTVLAILSPAPALAHLGHVGEAAGHDHWVAGAAIGIAVGIGIWRAAKDRKARAEKAEESAPEEQSA